MTHLCVTCLITESRHTSMWYVSSVAHSQLIHVEWLIYVWHVLLPSHVTHPCDMSYYRVTSHIHVTHAQVMPHIWLSDVTRLWFTSHIHELCHTFMSLVTCVWIMSHIHNSFQTFISHVDIPHIHELCHTFVSVVSHSWVLSHTHNSFHTFICPVTHPWDEKIHSWVMPHIHESGHTFMSYVTHS